MKIIPAIFEEHEIRRLYDEKTETWFFSVVDIIQVLTQQPDYQTARKYWNKLKERLGKEGNHGLPMSPIERPYSNHYLDSRLVSLLGSWCHV